MQIVALIIFLISLFIIFWAMIGYNMSVKFLGKLYKNKLVVKDYGHKPNVTVMVVAHNEEKVILDKLKNIIQLDYPKDKIKFLISSDNSTDQTNDIVRNFITENKDYDIKLYEVKQRKGKTNAQNEAARTVDTEYLVMTDANSMLDKKSIIELMASFSNDNISYVAGKLVYINSDVSDISNAENSYWDKETNIRSIESKIQTITAGNGALYACRTNEYIDFDLIESHDTAMPLYFSLKGQRAISNDEALVYEKAGEVVEDEFNRKVRMNRVLIRHILPDIAILNIYKYKWFSYFYFGHRTCRYLLWIAHLIVFLASGILIQTSNIFYLVFFGQVLFYLLAFVKFKFKIDNKYLNLIYYYTITILAQWKGVYNITTGKAKPFWEKAESTR